MAKKTEPAPSVPRRTLRVRKGGRYIQQPDGTVKHESEIEKEKGHGTSS